MKKRELLNYIEDHTGVAPVLVRIESHEIWRVPGWTKCRPVADTQPVNRAKGIFTLPVGQAKLMKQKSEAVLRDLGLPMPRNG